jgi:hypothetical protein
MMDVSNQRWPWRVACLAGCLLVVMGCSGPPQEVLYPVRGRISLDGRPLPRGAVSLRAESAKAWHQPTGTIEPSGDYVIYTNRRPGAPPGSYRVVVMATEAAAKSSGAAHPGLPKSLVPVRYNQPQRSPLRLEVVAKPASKAYDLELTSHEKSPR